MEKPKDYTSTIMRMAGNIAAGFVAARASGYDSGDDDELAERSVEIAEHIVDYVLKGRE